MSVKITTVVGIAVGDNGTTTWVMLPKHRALLGSSPVPIGNPPSSMGLGLCFEHKDDAQRVPVKIVQTFPGNPIPVGGEHIATIFAGSVAASFHEVGGEIPQDILDRLAMKDKEEALARAGVVLTGRMPT